MTAATAPATRSLATTTPTDRFTRAFAAHLRSETRLILREAAALIFGAVLPLAAIIVMSAIPAAREPLADFGGLSVVRTYQPTILLFATYLALYPALAALAFVRLRSGGAARQVLLFAHNFLVLLVVAAIFLVSPSFSIFLFVPGFLLVLALLVTTGLSLAIICARYRDIPHIVSNLLQISMFVTPIMFMKDMLGHRAFLAQGNPFYHMVDAIRAPLLGESPEASTWIFLVAANLASLALALWLMRRAGHRVPYLV